MNVPKRLPIRSPASTTVKWRRIIGHCRSNTGKQRCSQNANWRTDVSSRSFASSREFFCRTGHLSRRLPVFFPYSKDSDRCYDRGSGLPKAPCYFLGRDPLDESSGGFFLALMTAATRFINHTDPTCTGANVNQAVIGRTPVAAFFWPPQRKRPQRGGEPGPS
jgi:hypothetical protein